MPDEMRKCSDCGMDFPFSEAEQKFFQSKGFVPPKRCKACRVARKQRGDIKGSDTKKTNRPGGGDISSLWDKP